MRIEGTKFGTIEVDEATAITFASGMLGFPSSKRYVLLESSRGAPFGWLQSLEEPRVSFPVVVAEAVALEKPLPGHAELAGLAGVDAADLSVLLVIAPQNGGLVVNALAPLVVDIPTRHGAQVVLDPRVYSAATVVTKPPTKSAPPVTAGVPQTPRLEVARE